MQKYAIDKLIRLGNTIDLSNFGSFAHCIYESMYHRFPSNVPYSPSKRSRFNFSSDRSAGVLQSFEIRLAFSF